MDFETSERIERAVDDVFDYVSNPRNFPRWNSAVQAVSVRSGEGDPGSTYLMERDLPGGRVQNELEILDRDRPTKFAIRTTSGPTPFVYRYRFDSDGATTVVHLAAEVELSGIARTLGPLGARLVRRGVDANLATLKQILEATG
jgi:carbon monoxide dehydrogenase subunit G